MSPARIEDLRRTPILPDEFFALREEFERDLVTLPIFSRPRNVAIHHVLVALERMVWQLRPLGEREIAIRRILGQSVDVGMFSTVVHGILYSLTHLVRLLERRGGTPVGNVEYDAATFDEAYAALHHFNGVADTFLVFTDIELGWRSCQVEGTTITARSVSPARMARGMSVALRREAEENAQLVRSRDPRRAALFEMLQAVAVQRQGPYEPEPEFVDLALQLLRDGWRAFDASSVPDETSVRDQVTAIEVRRTVEALRAHATVQQVVADFQSPRPDTPVIRRPADQWIEFTVKYADLSQARALAALDLLLHSGGRDLRDDGRTHPAAAHTPLFDLGDGTWTFAPTLAIWHDTEHSLRAMWKTRAPADYGAKVAGLNDGLTDQTAALFEAKRWPTVKRRTIQGVSDIDAGTAIRDDDLFIACECKVFIDDPVRGADDPEVWRQLGSVVYVLSDPTRSRTILRAEQLRPTDIRGVVAVPGRAQSAADLGDAFALVGLKDLSDVVAAAASPREAWERIKANESNVEVRVETVTTQVGRWTLITDGVRRTDLLKAQLARKPAAEPS